MKYKANTPEGTRDRLYAECVQRRKVQGALTHLFKQRGYAEIITPAVEFYDTFLLSGATLPQESMLKIIDRSGKICVLRPDCTMQIARVAATKMNAVGMPQHLYYNQVIYRSEAENAGVSSEIPQCGVELIGAKGIKADAEIVAMAIDALKAAGAEHFHVEIGHIDFFQHLVDKMNLPEATVDEIKDLIEDKKFAALNDLLGNYKDVPGYAALNRISRMFGGPEVLDEAEALAGNNESLTYLRKLYDVLTVAGYAEYVQFDLGIVSKLDYYTGIVFRGYIEGAGNAVLSGGRYDNLIEAFGRKAEAIGFAVDVDRVANCVEAEAFKRPKTLIHYEIDSLAKALEIQKERFGELSPCDTLEETMELARTKGMQCVIVVDPDGERSVEV